MDIQVGDKVTYKNLNGKIIITLIINTTDVEYMKTREILKIERPVYNVIEEKKELLTEYEKTFLKLFMKLNQIEIISIKTDYTNLHIEIDNLSAILLIPRYGRCFEGLKIGKIYTLEELGLE